MPDSQSKARTSSGAIYVVAQGCSSRSAPFFLLVSFSAAGRKLPKERREKSLQEATFPIYIIILYHG